MAYVTDAAREYAKKLIKDNERKKIDRTMIDKYIDQARDIIRQMAAYDIDPDDPVLEEWTIGSEIHRKIANLMGVSNDFCGALTEILPANIGLWDLGIDVPDEVILPTYEWAKAMRPFAQKLIATLKLLKQAYVDACGKPFEKIDFNGMPFSLGDVYMRMLIREI